MAFTKEEADTALAGLGMTVTARRGGNLQISFTELAGFKHVIDTNTGEETMSRDEAIMRHQLAVVDKLREEGMPARISNIRRQDIGDQEVFTFSPSVWVNNTANASAGINRKMAADLAASNARFEALMSVLSPEQAAQVKAALAPQATGAAAEVPL